MTTATFVYDHRIIDIRRSEYRISQVHPLMNLSKVVVLLNFIRLICCALLDIEIDLVKPAVHVLLEVDTYIIQWKYYLWELLTDIYSNLLFSNTFLVLKEAA